MITRIHPPGPDETRSRDETVAEAVSAFVRDGAVIFDHIVPVSLIDSARAFLLQNYRERFGTTADGDRMVGDQRVMVTVDLEPPFTEADLLSNPWLESFLDHVLGASHVIDNFGAVCSLPGAQQQHCHRDGESLFPSANLDRVLPAAAVTVAIPLSDMNQHRGTTALFLGSHRGTGNDEPSIPSVPRGSCVAWDYRLFHRGTANLSEEMRPLLYYTYCRPWWTDHRNFAPGRPRLVLKASVAPTLTEQQRTRLLRAELV